MSLATLVDRNKTFAATDAVAKNPKIPWLPTQLVYIITCIDSRVEPAAILGVDLGDATVQRTIGGRVTPAVLRDVAYISYLTETRTPDGPWWELAVIHHTDCGSTLLADPEAAPRLRHPRRLRRGRAGLAAGHRPRRHRPRRRRHLGHRATDILQHQDQRVRLQHRGRHPRRRRRAHRRRQALTVPLPPRPHPRGSAPGGQPLTPNRRSLLLLLVEVRRGSVVGRRERPGSRRRVGGAAAQAEVADADNELP